MPTGNVTSDTALPLIIQLVWCFIRTSSQTAYVYKKKKNMEKNNAFKDKHE